MKSHIIRKAFALLALAAAPALADTPAYEAPLTDDDQLSLTCIDVDFGYMTDFDDVLSVDALYGVTFGTSYTFDATTKDYHKLTFSVGMFYGSDSFITPAPSRGMVSWLPSSQKNNQMIVPVMLEYSYHRTLCEDFSINVGARAGMYISDSEMSYVDITNNDPDFPYGGERGAYYHTKVSPVIGIGVGFEYNVSSNLKWNIGARFDFCHSMLQEPPRNIQYVIDRETIEKDVITTTIHTGFTYSF